MTPNTPAQRSIYEKLHDNRDLGRSARVGGIIALVALFFGPFTEGMMPAPAAAEIAMTDADALQLLQSKQADLDAAWAEVRRLAAEGRGATQQAQLARQRADELARELADKDALIAEREKLLNALQERLYAIAANDMVALRAQAEAALHNNDLAEAERILQQIIERALEDQRKAAKTAADGLMSLGEIAADDIRWQDAARLYARAAELDPRYDTLKEAGDYTDRIGDYAAAQPLKERAVKAAVAEFGPDSAEHATALNNLAALLYTRGDLDEAEPLYRQALKIRKAALGEQDPDYAASLNGLALSLQARGDLDGAVPLMRRAGEITKAARGEGHLDYARDLNNLAALLYLRGDLDGAEPLMRRAGDIQKAALGADHPDYANSLSNLAVLLFQKGDIAGAEPLMAQALAIREKTIPDHPDTEATRQGLAILRAKLAARD